MPEQARDRSITRLFQAKFRHFLTLNLQMQNETGRMGDPILPVLAHPASGYEIRVNTFRI